MSIKIIITNNNDILYNSLSNVALQNESKIEITNVPMDKLDYLICRIKPKDNVIIMDSITSVSFCNNVLRNAINHIDKGNIIILVIDSSKIANFIHQEKHQGLFKRQNTIFPLLDVVNIVSSSLKDSIEIEKNIDDILWKLGFTSYFKGSIYIKDAILMTYNDRQLLQDFNILIKNISVKNNVSNEKIVRSAMDKTLNNVLDCVDINVIYNIFGDNYDGRKISLKYFIDLFIRYLDEKRYCCLDY